MNINPIINPIIRTLQQHLSLIVLNLWLFLVPRHSSPVRNAATSAGHPCTAILSTCGQIYEQPLQQKEKQNLHIVKQWHSLCLLCVSEEGTGHFQCPLAWNDVTGRPVSELSTGTDPLWDAERVDRSGIFRYWVIYLFLIMAELILHIYQAPSMVRKNASIHIYFKRSLK